MAGLARATEVTIPVEPFVSGGGVVVAALITGCFAVLVAWAKPRFDRIENYAKPTGNGYADRTEAALKAIKDDVASMKKDVGGIREELRTERIERLAGDERLAQAHQAKDIR